MISDVQLAPGEQPLIADEITMIMLVLIQSAIYNSDSPFTRTRMQMKRTMLHDCSANKKCSTQPYTLDDSPDHREV